MSNFPIVKGAAGAGGGEGGEGGEGGTQSEGEVQNWLRVLQQHMSPEVCMQLQSPPLVEQKPCS